MAITQKLTESELALLEILDDPVWFGEFLRNTKDGQTQRHLWPKRTFSYRWYQKDLLTDQSPAVAVRGGRAIGKCQPATAQVLTPFGWKKIGQIIQEYERRRVLIPTKPVPFEIIAVTKNMKLVNAPAVIFYNGRKPVFRVTTKSGYSTEATKEHPLLTRHGYIALSELKVGDEIAVVGAIPDGLVYERGFTKPDELRLLGYWFLEPDEKVIGLYPRTKHVRDDIARIAQSLNIDFYERSDGAIALMRGKKYYWMLSDVSKRMGRTYGYFAKRFNTDYHFSVHQQTKLPNELFNEGKEQFRAFIEALFAQYADISRNVINIDVITELNVQILRRILLRFGVFFRVVNTTIIIDDPIALFRFFKQFRVPGVAVASVLPPLNYTDDWYFFDPIVSITQQPSTLTYAIQVHEHHVYLSDFVVSHNSLFVEDRILCDIFQHETRLPDTKEVLLLANNEAQVEPIMKRLYDRLRASPLLRQYVHNINRSDGVFDFRFPAGEQVLLRVRSTGIGNNQLVGLHVGKMYVDEAQLFSEESWQQAAPALNDWEQSAQVFVTGVPNGMRNSLLYFASKPSSGFKEYHIPAPNNPFYTIEQDELNKKRYGGEQSDAYQQLVLGNHGQAVQVLLHREQIQTKPIDYTPSIYTERELKIGEPFYSVIERPSLPYQLIAFGIDCGFVDPTVIVILGKNTDQPWQIAHKVVLKRVDFDTQVKIIDWLATSYKPTLIAIDTSTGGGGLHIVHTLQHNENYDRNYYRSVIHSVQFHGKMGIGYDAQGEEITDYVKSVGAATLVQMVSDGMIVFPEVDQELISEIERITRVVSRGGSSSYFILSEQGHGQSPNDHQFAALICFAVAIKSQATQRIRRRLALPKGLYQSHK